MVDRLKGAGVHFRNEIVSGVGGKQTIAEDPSGNPVELFQPILSEARLDSTPSARIRASAKISVQKSEAKPVESSAGPALAEVHIDERFSGDIDGESTVRALELRRDDHSANLVSMQQVRGTLGGRRGTFVLQGQETVANGRITATWCVVPGSGTEDLVGLRGEGGFQGEFGKGSDGTLDYWFE